MGRGTEQRRLELHRQAAHDALAQLFVVVWRAIRSGAAADFHVQQNGQIGSYALEYPEILRQHDLEPVDLQLIGRVSADAATTRWQQLLRQMVESDENAGRRLLELGVDRSNEKAHLILIGFLVDGMEDATTTRSHVRGDPGQHRGAKPASHRKLQLWEAVAPHQIETLEVVEEILAEIEPQRVGELTVDGTDTQVLCLIVSRVGEENLISVLVGLIAGVGLAKEDRSEILPLEGDLLLVRLEARRRKGSPVGRQLKDDSTAWRHREAAVAHGREETKLDQYLWLDL